MSREFNYECILKSRDVQLVNNIEWRVLYSVNKFKSINQVAKWLRDVNFDKCLVEIYRKDGSSIDPFDLMEVYDA